MNSINNFCPFYLQNDERILNGFLIVLFLLLFSDVTYLQGEMRTHLPDYKSTRKP